MSALHAYQFAAVQTYDQLASQPGYLQTFSPSQDNVVEVLYHYKFVSQCQCGISSCRQHHNEGYVVRLASGHISQIGGHCWKSKFRDIGTALNRYQEEQERPRLISQLLAHRAASEAYRVRSRTLRNDLEPLIKFKTELKSHFPKIDLELKQKADHGGIYPVIRVTETLKEEAQSKPDIKRTADDFVYFEQTLGLVQGCNFLSESAFHFIVEVDRIITEISSCSLSSLSFSKLYYYANEGPKVDEYLSRAALLLSAGRRLFGSESELAIKLMASNREVEGEAKRFSLAALNGVPSRPLLQTPPSTKKMGRKERKARWACQ